MYNFSCILHMRRKIKSTLCVGVPCLKVRESLSHYITASVFECPDCLASFTILSSMKVFEVYWLAPGLWGILWTVSQNKTYLHSYYVNATLPTSHWTQFLNNYFWIFSFFWESMRTEGTKWNHLQATSPYRFTERRFFLVFKCILTTYNDMALLLEDQQTVSQSQRFNIWNLVYFLFFLSVLSLILLKNI